MTENQENTMTENQEKYNQYVHALVAARALKSGGGRPTAESALEKLAGDMGIRDPGAQKTFVKSYGEPEEALQYAIDTYSKKYFEGLGRQTIASLLGSSASYDRYVGDKMKDVLAEFGNETFKDVKDKVESAMEVLNSKTTNFDEEAKEKAKKILEKYMPLYRTLVSVEDQKVSSLHAPLEQESISRSFQERYKPKPKEKKPEN